MPDPIKPTAADRDEEAAAAFGEAFRAEQANNYGCSGSIECTFPMHGNCWCFNRTLGLHARQAREQALEEAAALIERDGMTTNHAGVPVMAEINQVLATAIRALKEPHHEA